ncbi:MAG TPA: glycerate kinase [Candidatus Cybelea sp.]|nr:glycerate kinase [Candidatus Cybelea sp.]
MGDKIVIAPDKFKGSLSAMDAARAMENGVLRVRPAARCTLCPMADGGEGTVDVFLERGAQRRTSRVRGPRGAWVDAVYARNGQTAILEMSSASGLGLLEPSQYDPTQTDTFGTGQLILAALDGGATRIIMGIGGSATNDAGTGMLRALGVRFLDASGTKIDGDVLEFARVESIDLEPLDARIAETSIEVAVDVDNPLCGPDGATRTFGAQKGATPEQIERLENALGHIAEVSAHTLGRDESDVPGAGAAGGLGFALLAFLGAKLLPGVRLIARECGLDELLCDATLCLTGEGKIDLQTLHGKTVYGVGTIAREHGVPTIAFGGVVDPQAEQRLADAGIATVAITPAGMPLGQAMRSAAKLLEAAAERAVSG